MSTVAARSIARALVIAVLAALLVPLPGWQAPAEAARANYVITLGADGVVDGEQLMVRAIGGRISWENRSGRELTVTSADGVLDSGPIPDGGSFRIMLDAAGYHEWESEVGGGTIQVSGELSWAPPNGRAADAIPDLAFPPRPEGDLAVHPELGIQASKSRALVTFAPDASYGNVNYSLSRQNLAVIGGLPEIGVALVALRSRNQPSSFSSIENAVSRLRNSNYFEHVSLELIESTATVPPASDIAGDWQWYWDPSSVAEDGRGGNWTSERSRVPAAWNVLESLELDGGPHTGTVVVDNGFEPHADLSRLQILQLCQAAYIANNGDQVAQLCTSTDAKDHGNHVAGIVGADLERRNEAGTGVAGPDQLGPLLGLSWKLDGSTGTDGPEGASVFTAYELLLREMKAGRLGDVRVINHSTAFNPDAATWRDEHGGATCGPGRDDDDAGSDSCFPDNEDGFLAETAAYGAIMRKAVARFVEELAQPPLFVAAAGNNSNDFCEGLAASCAQGRPMRTEAMSSMAWASANWTDTGVANPLLVVESIGQILGPDGEVTGPHEKDLLEEVLDRLFGEDTTGRITPNRDRSAFSNLGGDISAPGLAVSTETSAGTKGTCTARSNAYCFQNGTSQAAPLVAGIAGLLTDADPSLGVTELRNLLLAWSIDDTRDGASPRVDAYGPLLAVDGVARRLVDVNDPSADGNRRVITPATTSEEAELDEELSSHGEEHGTDPDGTIDLRDFRRFRDAYLAACLLGAGDACPAEVELDGPTDHPKRDLNLDGCVGWYLPEEDQDCPSELTFPRFDFNGDGIVSRTARARVGLQADGSPAPDPAGAAEMTDLEILASQWDEDSAWSQGLTGDGLDALLDSGDLTIHGDGLESIADEVEVVIESADDDQELFAGVLDVGGDPGVATVPAGRPLEISVLADGPTDQLEFTVETPALAAGEDRRVELCGGLTVEVEPDSLRPDGASGEVVARVSACGGDPSGVPVDLVLTPDEAGGAALVDETPITDQDGVARAEVTPGTRIGDYTIDAVADVPLGPGATVTRVAQTRLRVADPYDYDLVAEDTTGSGYGWLRDTCSGSGKLDGCLLGPAINAGGDVAFRAERTGSTAPSVFVAPEDAGPTDPTDPASALDLTADALPAGAWIAGGPSISDDGEVVIATQRSDSLTRQQSWIHRLHAAQPGTVTDVVEASTDEADGTTFARVDCPTISADGEVAFTGEEHDGSHHVARPDADGYRSGLGTANACAELASDGTTVTSSLRSTGETDDRGFPIYEGLILVGDDVQQQRIALVDGADGWERVGGPTLADTGAAVAFTGDRGNGEGIWLGARDGEGLTGWQDPVLIAGANGTSPRPELGHGPDGTPRYLTDIGNHETGDLFRYGSSGGSSAIHLPRGPEGLAGDRIIVAFLGTPNDAGDGFTDQPGVWTVAVDVVADDDGTLSFEVGRPVAAVQLGQSLAGGVIEELALGDALAPAATPERADDHWLVFGAEADAPGTDDDRAVIVRARWQGSTTYEAAEATASSTPPATPTATGTATPTVLRTSTIAASTAATPIAGSSTAEAPTADAPTADAPTAAVRAAVAATAEDPEVEMFDERHVAAVVVSDDEPARGDSITFTNRTRTVTGRPAWTVLDIDPDSDDVHDDLPRVMAPDEAFTTVVPDHTGNLVNDSWQLALGALAVARTDVVEFQVEAQELPNQAPVVDLGGPYTIPVDGELRFEPDVDDDRGLDNDYHHFDYDGDGDHDDGDTGLSRWGSRVHLDADQVHDLVCGGSCVEDQTYTIGLRYEDREGASATDTTTVTISGTQDFGLRIQPSLLRAPADTRRSAYATIEPVDGFAGQVELEVTDAPDGWSTDVDSPVQPDENAEIYVRPPEDVVEDLFELEVTARSGAIERRETFTVSTAFGLVPQCDIDVAGTVTDAVTGEPIAGAEIASTYPRKQTGADGGYRYPVSFREGFEVQEHRVWVEATGYYAHRSDVLLTCGDDEQIQDVALEPIPTGAIEGRVVEGVANSVRGGTVPVGEPIPGARVFVRYLTGTDADDAGRFELGDGVYVPDETRNLFVEFQADGYWPHGETVTFEAGTLRDVGDIGLIEQCTGTVGGGTVVDQNGDPVADSRVVYGGESLRTDGDGRFDFDTDGVLLGENNRPRTVTIIAYAPDDWDVPSRTRGAAQARIARCGDTTDDVTIEITRPAPPPEDHYASVEGTVTDELTGEPIPYAQVRVGGVDGYADEHGEYRFDDLYVGKGDDTTASWSVAAQADGYWQERAAVLVEADQTVTVDLALLARRTGSIAGRVLDQETGEPIPDAYVRPAGVYGMMSEADGGFLLDDLDLAHRNAPTTYDVIADVTDDDGDYVYWPHRVWNVPVEADTVTEQDVELLRVCDGATIVGTVVDATTLEPLEDVTVWVGGDPQRIETDADGRFAIPDIVSAEGNEARDVTVHAAKSGYFGASKDVTVFCDAEVIVDFGTPDRGFGTIVGTVTDPDGAPLEDVFVGSAFGGSATTDADGNYRIERAPLAAEGADREWTVTAIDGSRRAEADVTVSADEETRQDFVLGEDNTPPTAGDVAVTTPQDTAAAVPLAGDDPDGDPLEYEIVDGPSHGALAGEDGSRTYTPDAGWNGEDSFTYRVSDGLAWSEPATVTVTVEEVVNTPPELLVPEERTVTAGTSSEVEAIATDADGDPLTLSASGLPAWMSFSDDGDGVGTFSLAPDAADAGATATVTVTASDGTDTVERDITVTVVATQENRPPTARITLPDVVLEGDDLVLDGSGSSDPDGDLLTFGWLVDGEHHDGEVVTIPVADDASLAVELRVLDGEGGQHVTTATVEVDNVAPQVAIVDPRDAADRRASVEPDELLELTANFEDPGVEDVHEATIDWGDGVTESVVVEPGAGRGSTVAAAAADGRVRGQHAYLDVGTYEVVVEVCDDDGGCGTSTVTVDVERVVARPEGEEPEREPDPEPEPTPEPDAEPDAEPEPTPEPGGERPASPASPGDGPGPSDPEVISTPSRPAGHLPLTGSDLLQLVLIGVLALAFGAAATRTGRGPAARTLVSSPSSGGRRRSGR